MTRLKVRELDFPPNGADDLACTYFAVEDDRVEQCLDPPAIVRVAHGFAHCYACEGSINCHHATLALKEVDQWG